MAKVLLDTCGIIWAISQPDSLSETAREILQSANTMVYVSPISIAEIACAVAKNRLTIEQHWKKWFMFYVEKNGWEVENISIKIMAKAYSLPDTFHPDPADRIIVATARVMDYCLLTADKKILAYPHVNAIW